MTSGGRWRGNQPMPTFYEMQGKTLGIIGFGTIGKRVARIAAGGFDMRIQYNDIVRLPEHEEDALNVRYRLLPELMRTSDIVTLHVPLTSLTRNMISTRELGYMQPHAVLINCSRGPVIDFPALHEALTAGRIAGAGLDVFPQEPPSPSEPVLSLDNVVLTPHLAGASRETRVKQTRNAFDNVLRVAPGRASALGGAGTARHGGQGMMAWSSQAMTVGKARWGVKAGPGTAHDRARRPAAPARGGDGASSSPTPPTSSAPMKRGGRCGPRRSVPSEPRARLPRVRAAAAASTTRDRASSTCSAGKSRRDKCLRLW